jgi:hypothetical protein
MKMTGFWDIVQCNLVEVDWCFRDAYCLHHQSDMVEVVHNSQMSVCFSDTTYVVLCAHVYGSGERNFKLLQVTKEYTFHKDVDFNFVMKKRSIGN